MEQKELLTSLTKRLPHLDILTRQVIIARLIILIVSEILLIESLYLHRYKDVLHRIARQLGKVVCARKYGTLCSVQLVKSLYFVMFITE